jgi:hypothetical protein
MSFLKYLLPGWKNLLTVKSSANAGILAAIDAELTDTANDIVGSRDELSLANADGAWLDQYGSLLGLYRKNGEEDSDFRTRIIDYVKTDKVTLPAITAAVQSFLNDNTISVEVYEPYKNIFTLNSSHLNSKDSFQGSYYTTAVIDIKIGAAIPNGLADYLNDYAPAGVTVVISHTNEVVMDGGSADTIFDLDQDGGQFTTATYGADIDGGSW